MAKLYLIKLSLITLAIIVSGITVAVELCRVGRWTHPNCELLPSEDQCGVVRVHQRVVGGHDATLAQFPWIALLYYQKPGLNGSEEIELVCGGSVVTERYVVTAAHCLCYSSFSSLRIRLGEHNLSSLTGDRECSPHVQDFEVESVIHPPNYNVRTFEYDISLIRLQESINFTRYIHPICLPTDERFREEATFKRKLLDVAGWGVNNQEGGVNTRPDVLQTVALPFVPKRQCNRERLSATMLCAGGEEGKDACMGDSGGPLMGQFSPNNTRNRYFLIGVVSFGSNLCGQTTAPGVYANVPALVTWLLDSIY